MADYSNLVKLGIVNVDPGAILGRPSAGLCQPLKYAPLTEPLQKPDYAGITAPSGNDTYVGSKKGKRAKKDSAKSGKLRNFNWKKFLGITSIAVLAIFGLPKLIKKFPELKQKFPEALKKVGDWFKKIPEALKKIPNYFKKTPKV